VFYKNPTARINRACARFIICFAFWSFGYIFLNDPYSPEDIVRFAMNIGAAGWVSFGSFFLWFILIFTEREKILKAKISYLVIFLPPAFLVYKQWTAASLIEQYLRQPYGWSYLYSKSIWHYVFYAWYLSCLLLAFYLCIDYGNRTKDRSKKILANLMYLSAIPIMIAGTINSVILQKLNIHSIPIFTDIYVFGWLFSVVYAINKY
jgi:hypothetical protein